MIFQIFVIFLISFTPINTTPCKENPICECSTKKSNELNIVCDVDNSTGYTVNIKSRNNITIVCKNWKTWENFYINGCLSEKRIQSLSFEQCGLPNGISLKAIAKQLGVTETHTLIFKSYKNLLSSLKREHFQGFQSVKSLVLSNNGIFNISNDLLLDFLELEYIDLSNNNFDPPANIFDATPNLRRIILVSSGIDTIPFRTFFMVTNLEFLNIMSNRLEKIEDGTFNHLVSLTSLNLAMNLFSVLPSSTFHGLKNLNMLDISMNYFTSLPANLFDQNKELRELYLHNNRNEMSTLPDNLLANLTKLTEVHLNNNGFLFLPENLFWGSSFLQYIFLNDNSLVTLPKNIFRGLNQVKKLSINNNKIETLPDKIFEDMKELRVLDLSNNQIVQVSRDLLLGLRSLNELNMERNQLNDIDMQSLFPLTKLSVAKFSHNPLQLPYLSSFILPSLEITLDLSCNKIRNIHFDKIEEMEASRWEKRNIVINLEHNPLLCDCTLYDLLRYREGKMSNLVYNYYNFIMGNLTCVQPDGTNEIEISNLNSSTYECLEHKFLKIKKKCPNDCTCSIRPSDNTRILDCSYKNMSEFLINETRVIFQKDPPFILNLTGNFLTEIPSTEPLYPINITGLLLSNNKISSITIDKLPYSLKILELHNNHISRIFTHELNYLKSIYWKKFTLSGNPIICDCKSRNFIEFVQSHRIYYKDLDNLICEDTHIPMHQMSINELCTFYLPPSIILAYSTTILVFVVIFIFFRRKNIKSWYLRHIPEHSVDFDLSDTEE
ncbi:protein toll-like isoform X2 [Polistes fuscatus]|uniref:protein toll-like isoform X2 n=1 Tax=Polistes fuscatus TaxID=30207 RepID=UPI001CA9679B|nr:protein toll-like isoform X2 [Polistes fuscatus]